MELGGGRFEFGSSVRDRRVRALRAASFLVSTGRGAEEARVQGLHLLGAAGAWVRRSAGAAAYRWARAGGAWWESDWARVHRGLEWGLVVRGAASVRIRQSADIG